MDTNLEKEKTMNNQKPTTQKPAPNRDDQNKSRSATERNERNERDNKSSSSNRSDNR